MPRSKTVLRDPRAATIFEYVLIVVPVAVATITAMSAISMKLSNTVNSVTATMGETGIKQAYPFEPKHDATGRFAAIRFGVFGKRQPCATNSAKPPLIKRLYV